MPFCFHCAHALRDVSSLISEPFLDVNFYPISSLGVFFESTDLIVSFGVLLRFFLGSFQQSTICPAPTRTHLHIFKMLVVPTRLHVSRLLDVHDESYVSLRMPKKLGLRVSSKFFQMLMLSAYSSNLTDLLNMIFDARMSSLRTLHLALRTLKLCC